MCVCVCVCGCGWWPLAQSKVWDVALEALESGAISQEKFDSLVGQFMIRSILFSSAKQKAGPEGRTFNSHDEIKNQFCNDLESAAGDARVDVSSIRVVGVDTSVVKDDKVDAKPAILLDYQQSNNPMHIFNENGFKVGDFVKELGGKCPFVFKVVSAGEKVRVSKFTVFEGEEPFAVDIPLKQFLANWAKDNTLRKQILDVPEDEPPVLSHDLLRGECFKVLYEAAANDVPVLYVINPTSLVAAEDVPKGSLKLVPFTTLSNIFCEKKTAGVELKIGKSSVFVTTPPKPHDNNVMPHQVFSPFWWVQKTSDESLVNMTLQAKKVEGNTMPVLVNSKAIKKHDVLYQYQAKVVKVQLQGGEVVAPEPKRRRSSGAKRESWV